MLETSEIFLLLSSARCKLGGKLKTSAGRYWKKFEKVLGLDSTIISKANNQLEKDKKELCRIEKEASDVIKTIIKGGKNDL